MSANNHSSTVSGRELCPGVAINPAAWTPAARAVLTGGAVDFIAGLHRKLERERQELLAARQSNQARINAGELPDYLERSSKAASTHWKINPIPDDLMTRRVEITGPVNSAKMVINMLSRSAEGARADASMLDFEDSLKPSWANVMDGQLNVQGAARGDLRHEEKGKVYQLDPNDMAVVLVRPRGLHLNEANLTVDGRPVSGGLLDLGLAMYHAGGLLVERGKTPAFYIPKTEHHLEARWWNRLFVAVQEALGMPLGTIKATFLMETLPAAFQMEEILYEAREHAVGLNVGRWDKIFSDIKVLRNHRDRVLADRASITMQRPWMANYALRCVQISHAHGAFGIGGMSAFTPGRTAALRAEQTAKVVADKQNEFNTGHDGCWVSHPYFIGPAMQAFTKQNQLDVLHAGRDKYPDLLPQAIGPKTMAGLRTNVRVGIGYMNGWKQDIGCVAWDNLMEDLATLEISRVQTWQWLHYGVQLDDGPAVSRKLVQQVFQEELDKIATEVRQEQGAQADAAISGFERAAKDAEAVFTREELSDFLTNTSELAT
ncbi:MAG: malate synthase A [Candidatus Lambdaproteobacteria bacterium]|nr:malate synthase A [Candidatus Lambdaproteobacteria bacterium]